MMVKVLKDCDVLFVSVVDIHCASTIHVRHKVSPLLP